jgi:hypothetical protein
VIDGDADGSSPGVAVFVEKAGKNVLGRAGGLAV